MKSISKSLQRKMKIVEELIKFLEKYPCIIIASITGVEARVLQEIRFRLRDRSAVLKVVKNTLVKKAIEKISDKRKNIIQLSKYLTGQNALIFTSENPFSIKIFLDKNKIPREARPGDIAPNDIIIPAGNTNFAPGPILSLFSKLKIPTSIKEGSIWVTKDTMILRKGETITPEVAELLKRLDIKPILVGVNIKAAYIDNIILTAEDLLIDLDKERDKIVDAFSQALSLSINIGYPLKENIEMLISKAYNEGYGLSVEVNYPIKENIVHIIGKALSLSNTLMQKIGEKNEAFKGV